ncbi:hypothetical protein KIN20_005537 [Parelaphostrongylus tenuis]|uniref:Uncharacterized protein n=1 Tax=Parelaphostrongylus tenuis TaxID=148309 RepID=A0AAD5MLD9_PARTN|nr:hypothetical protein KIN20_005537 [Parelaphostrongylus tenuis]
MADWQFHPMYIFLEEVFVQSSTQKPFSRLQLALECELGISVPNFLRRVIANIFEADGASSKDSSQRLKKTRFNLKRDLWNAKSFYSTLDYMSNRPTFQKKLSITCFNSSCLFMLLKLWILAEKNYKHNRIIDIQKQSIET